MVPCLRVCQPRTRGERGTGLLERLRGRRSMLSSTPSAAKVSRPGGRNTNPASDGTGCALRWARNAAAMVAVIGTRRVDPVFVGANVPAGGVELPVDGARRAGIEVDPVPRHPGGLGPTGLRSAGNEPGEQSKSRSDRVDKRRGGGCVERDGR